MPRKKGKKRTKGLSILFISLLVIGVVAFVIGIFRCFKSSATELPIPYSATKPCNAYSQNGELAAWVNVTLRTNASVPQPNLPINITLKVKGIYVPYGNWTYAILEGATAAFPSKEPSNWNYSVKNVIVLTQFNDDPFTYYGSRIMNYTFGGDWNIILHVNARTVFIVNNIPPNPTNLPIAIYTIPNAVSIASAESVAQMKASEESERTNRFWSGISFIFVGLGFIATAIIERIKKR